MKFHFAFGLAAAFFALILESARGGTVSALSLSIDDGVGNPAAVSLVPGASFNFRLQLINNGQPTHGLGFSLSASGPANAVFTVTARDLAGTAFPDLTTSNSTLLTPANAVLDPTPGTSPNAPLDLGGLTENQMPINNGIFQVADYSFLLAGNAPPGVYTITTIMTVATDPDFNALPVEPATYTVNVVPEPATFGLLALGGLALAARYRRGSRFPKG